MAVPGTDSLTPAAMLKFAVQTCYNEEASPKGPLLQMLLTYMTGFKPTHLQIYNAALLSPDLKLDSPLTKKMSFCVHLRNEPSGFKGFADQEPTEVISPEMRYNGVASPAAFEDATKVFKTGGWIQPEETTQKYLYLALKMQEVSPVLRETKFGVCLALVRWGCTQNLLGKRDQHFVPWDESEEAERLMNAMNRRPTAVNADEDYVRNWDELKVLLSHLLNEQPEPELEVSRLKIMFRTRFAKELSETAFGHCNLTDLLRDPEIINDFMMITDLSSKRQIRVVRSRAQYNRKLAASEALCDQTRAPVPKADESQVKPKVTLQLSEAIVGLGGHGLTTRIQ